MLDNGAVLLLDSPGTGQLPSVTLLLPLERPILNTYK
jgi:hypothetical protein